MLFWRKKYSLENDRIDEQHKELFKIANQILTEDLPQFRQKKELNKKKLKAILHKIYDYMKFHFHDEEEYMKSIGYPYLEEHKRTHEYIIKEVNKMVKSAHSLSELERNIFQMLHSWIVKHIMEDDKQIEDWYIENKKSKGKLSKRDKEKKKANKERMDWSINLRDV